MPLWIFAQGRLELFEGDLTLCDADAIVNAANPGLLGGGGVDGAIHRAAGPELLAACRALVDKHGPLPTGQAVLTPGFGLAARFVIHTVGPVWRGGGFGEAELLRSAYGQSLALAKRHGLASVIFPALSCGSYGYPLDLAAPLALAALRHGLKQGLAARLGLCLHGSPAHDFWCASAEKLFGAPQVP